MLVIFLRTMSCISAQSFTDNELHFCTVQDFNDPFECAFQVQFSQDKRENIKFGDLALKRQYPNLSSQERDAIIQNEADIFDDPDYALFVRETMRQGFNKWGICCLSKVRDNVLMWSHYANKHRGFCLEFSTEQFSVGLTTGRTGPLPVHYTDKYPVARIIDEIALRETILTKAEQWEYEKEWRIITPEQTGLYPFPSHCLTGVIFGCRMLEKHKEMIREWCRNREPAIKYYETRESEDSYTLDIVELS